jgi:hypothetical protein
MLLLHSRHFCKLGTNCSDSIAGNRLDLASSESSDSSAIDCCTAKTGLMDFTKKRRRHFCKLGTNCSDSIAGNRLDLASSESSDSSAIDRAANKGSTPLGLIRVIRWDGSSSFSSSAPSPESARAITTPNRVENQAYHPFDAWNSITTRTGIFPCASPMTEDVTWISKHKQLVDRLKRLCCHHPIASYIHSSFP